MSEKKRRTCHICGAGFVPTSGNQKYCPDCRKNMQKDGTIKDKFLKYQQARLPGKVTVSQIETPEVHLMDMTETPEEPRPEVTSYMDPYYEAAIGGDRPSAILNGGGGGSGGPILEQSFTEEPSIEHCYEELQKAIDMPDDLAVIEEHAEILRRYYKGELVDKNELLARIRERLGEF